MLPRFFHLSRDDAKLLAVELVPRDVVPLRESVTEIGQRRTSVPASLGLAVAVPAEEITATLSVPVHPLNSRDPKVLDRTGQFPVAVKPEATEPMTGQLSRLHLTVSRELLAKIEAAQLALSHARPGATMADLLELGADTALAQDARRKGVVRRPRQRRSDMRPFGPDHIPAEIRRAVWERDRGCCQWKMANGEICGSRYRLQFDHIEPKALGGKTTVANVRLLCQRHNLFAARQALGEKLMRRYRRHAARSPSSSDGASPLALLPSPGEPEQPRDSG